MFSFFLNNLIGSINQTTVTQTTQPQQTRMMTDAEYMAMWNKNPDGSKMSFWQRLFNR